MYKLLLFLLLLSVNTYATSIDSCAYYKRKVDTLNHKLYMSNKQLTLVRYYIKICEVKPTNKKFLYGWIKNRALK
jgi:hypothetical protein